MGRRLLRLTFRILTSFSLVCLTIVLVFFYRIHAHDSLPPLQSESKMYWDGLEESFRGFSAYRHFREGLPEETDFATWFVETTNEFARTKAVQAIVKIDRARSTVFIRWMERRHPEWKRERKAAFAFIAAATVPYWETNRPPIWNKKEIAEFSRYFRDCLESEMDYQCRFRIDSFFEKTIPEWKTSDERLRFLEHSLSLCSWAGPSNEIRRVIENRFSPPAPDRYERWHDLIRH